MKTIKSATGLLIRGKGRLTMRHAGSLAGALAVLFGMACAGKAAAADPTVVWTQNVNQSLTNSDDWPRLEL